MSVTFTCDLANAPVALKKPLLRCVGSCHAPMALRADWQEHMRRAHRDLGFEYVRFHGILGDDMGTLVDENNAFVYSFLNTDRIFDFLGSIGMKPIVELSFMPSALSSGSDTVFHYRGNITPPHDYAEWGELMRRLVAHWLERYGEAELLGWYFEVWNEPNLKAFWSGDQAAYFLLYKTTVEAIKSVHPGLRVGGPTTAQNAWIPEFVAYCDGAKLPYDFVSTHYYPTDAFGQIGSDTITQLANAPLDVMRTRATEARAVVPDKPLLYTEWNITSNPRDSMHDGAFAAALATRIAMSVDDQVDVFSYWVVSDLFEENYLPSIPYHGGFGLLNLYGVPKPIYRAFEMIGALGSCHWTVEGSSETAAGWVGNADGDAGVNVLFLNQAMPRHPIEPLDITLSLTHCPRAIESVTIRRIDEDHANPEAAWRRAGAPEYLSHAQVALLERESVPLAQACAYAGTGSDATISFHLPAQALAALEIRWKAPQ